MTLASDVTAIRLVITWLDDLELNFSFHKLHLGIVLRKMSFFYCIQSLVSARLPSIEEIN